MPYQDLVEKYADRFIKDVITDIYASHNMRSYLHYNIEQLYTHVSSILNTGCNCLQKIAANPQEEDELMTFFVDIGHDRFANGVPLNEVVGFIMLAKKRLQQYIDAERLDESTYGLNQLNQLSHLISTFFNRIISSIIQGYEDGFNRKTETACVEDPRQARTSYSLVVNK